MSHGIGNEPQGNAAGRRWRTLVVAAIAAAIAACGGGGGGGGPAAPSGTGNPPPAPPPPPPEPTVTVPTDLPVLFVEVSEDISEFNDVIGEVIEGNLQNFLQFVPATGELALVATNRSISYAESISTLKVFDDRVFVVNVSETGARITELNTDSMLEAPASVPVPTPRSQDSLSERCLAVLGDDLVYKVAHRRAPAPQSGYEDGPLLRVPGFFSATGAGPIETITGGLTGQGTSPSPGGFVTDACRGYFDVADGAWYDTEIGFANGVRNFFRKELQTGDLTLLGELPDQSPALVSMQAYDDDTAYLAGLDTASQVFTLATLHLAAGTSDSTGVDSIADYVDDFTATGLTLIDADDGYAAFVLEGADRDVVMLYEPVSGSFTAFDAGVHVNQMQLMFRGS